VTRLRDRFHARGVFWRELLRFAAINTPAWLEPIVIAWWALFFLLWGAGRRGIMRNISAIKPGSTALANFFRSYRVFWNYAWTIGDNERFKTLRVIPDWEFVGWKYFEEMQARGGILLTAHMGSYDLGAHLFSETSGHALVMVRAPEEDPRTRAFEKSHSTEALRVEFSTESTELALDLLHAIREGSIVAIQGDRVTSGISEIPAMLFGVPVRVPAGPFALAMAARAPIYPVFNVRLGRRRYRLVAREPIEILRTANRDEAFAQAVSAWTRELEAILRSCWYQWFNFEHFFSERT
jgi:phosphatidylinositol dimannoside acyltransferase